MILAGIHAGMFKYPEINECLHVPELIDSMGVDKSATILRPDGKKIEVEVTKIRMNDIEYKIYRHPYFFITEDVLAWYEVYKMTENNRHIKLYDALFWDAMLIYENALNKFLEQRSK